ncbi:OB-fold nucleic acid binding domain-containing protein, partial [Psychrobacillus psychrotolerans]
MMKRTHTSGQLNEQQIGETVQLIGWVQKRRDLGGLIFVDLRDRTGLVQVVFNPEISESAIQIADKLRNEF